MNRMNLALPLIGAMMTASLAYAQTTPSAPTPAPAAQEPAATTNEATQPEGADCVDVGALDGADVARASGDSASETQPVQGADSGTAPGGAGSTGWTGGTGGSDIGTSQAEELPTSPEQDHPEVARGLDPISGETKAEGPKAPPPAPAPVAPAAEARAC